MKTQNNKQAVFFAILAALLYAFSSPLSKLLLSSVSTTMMSAFLYFGAGMGLSAVNVLTKKSKSFQNEVSLSKKDIPLLLIMCLLDIAAPICMMCGLTMTTAANASLLGNFEIFATAVIALLLFNEKITKRLWLAVFLVLTASVILTFEDFSSLSFSKGSVLVIAATVFWGLENNVTKKLAHKNPIQIIIVNGFVSGTGAAIISFALKCQLPKIQYILAALLLGFVSYGMSVYFYLLAQRSLGAAKTGTYYATAPFIGVFISLILFKEIPKLSFIAAFIIMLIGTYFASTDKKVK